MSAESRVAAADQTATDKCTVICQVELALKLI